MAHKHPDFDTLIGLLLQIDDEWRKLVKLKFRAMARHDDHKLREARAMLQDLKKVDTVTWALLDVNP